ncbi:MAG: prepilin-type N-terminal cleavage/methylation domain-containing protein [Gemmatimonadota bacterium]
MRRRTEAFTLIELLIVIIIIGLLASIVIPRFFSTKERAFVAAMRSDLRNLTMAQDAYFSETQTYTSNLSLLTGMFAPSQNVTVTVDSATATGWGAKATNPGTNVVCTVAVSRIQVGSPTCATP